MSQPYIIGVSGGSGSGKTTFIRALAKNFSAEELCVISLDHYYKPQSQQPLDINGIPNYDTPNSIDIEAFLNDLNGLLNGKKVQKLEYDFNNPNYKAQMLTFYPAKVLLIEGIFIYNYATLLEKFDLKIFIDTLEQLRIKRRISRDLQERGYKEEETLYFLKHHEAPGYTEFVEPHKSNCHIIIPNNQDFSVSLPLIENHIKNRLK